MPVYSLPSLSDSQAADLASSLGSTGEGFTLSPSGSGYSVSSESSTIGAMIQGAFSNMAASNAGATSSSSDPFLSALEGQFGLDTGVTNDATSSGALGSVASGSSSSASSSIGKWLEGNTANILAVVVGLIFLALGVFGMVNK